MTFQKYQIAPHSRIESPILSNKLALLVQAVVTTFCLAIILRLWRADLTVPFNYQGDTIFELSLVKSIASGNWIWFNQDLGAPFGFDTAAFPQNLTFSSVVMKILSGITSDPAVILNCFWILSCIFSSVFCHFSLNALGISRFTSLVVSTLYALLPYAFMRNTAHISLTYTFVPILAAYAIWVLSESSRQERTTREKPVIPKLIMIFACIAIGIDYIYNAFFTCFFFSVVGIFGSFYSRSLRPLRLVGPYLALVLSSAFVNLIPSLLTWYHNGIPPNMGYKNAAESEIYGLKIRHVVGSYLTDKFSRKVIFPLENENTFARLGIVLAAGYIGALIIGLFGKRTHGENIAWAAGILTIIGTLFATIGGFGAIFNVLVIPDIRAYNRIIVFLAFFSCVTLGFMLDFLRGRCEEYFGRFGLRTYSVPASYTLLICLLFVGLFDQSHAASPLLNRYGGDMAQAAEERDIVRRVEMQLPDVRRIYQLPNTNFPPDPGQNRMEVYDHGRPYLWSRNLEWSWPSFSYQHEAWLTKIGLPTSNSFIKNLVISGFDGIWIDQFGYSETALADLKAALEKVLGAPVIASKSGRYVFYSLIEQQRKLGTQLGPEKMNQLQKTFLNQVILRFEKGFYDEEVSSSSSDRFRWSGQTSRAFLANPSGETRQLRLRALVQGNPGGQLNISANRSSAVLNLDGTAKTMDMSVNLAPHSRYKVEFHFIGSQIVAPGDKRSMYFALINPTLIEDK